MSGREGVREAVHLDTGDHLPARRDDSGLFVEVELADHIHAEVGHEGHVASAWLEHDGVRVWVALPLRLVGVRARLGLGVGPG